jgi:hypothetical protein
LRRDRSHRTRCQRRNRKTGRQATRSSIAEFPLANFRARSLEAVPRVRAAWFYRAGFLRRHGCRLWSRDPGPSVPRPDLGNEEIPLRGSALKVTSAGLGPEGRDTRPVTRPKRERLPREPR